MRLEELARLGLADLARRREQDLVVALGLAVAADELEREHGELIRAVARARLAIVDHRIAEAADVTARLPDLGVHEQRAVEADHAERRRCAGRRRRLVVVRDHVVPPGLLQVALELDAERAIVPCAVQATIDLARRKDESSSLAQRHYFFHRIHDRDSRAAAKNEAGKYSDATSRRCGEKLARPARDRQPKSPRFRARRSRPNLGRGPKRDRTVTVPHDPRLVARAQAETVSYARPRRGTKNAHPGLFKGPTAARATNSTGSDNNFKDQHQRRNSCRPPRYSSSSRKKASSSSTCASRIRAAKSST